MAEPLEPELDRLAARVRGAKSVFLFSDFDGTLTSIKDRPGECQLDSEVARTLTALAAQAHVRVAIVSGRDMRDLRARVGLDHRAELDSRAEHVNAPWPLDRIAYAGNHGLEIEGAGFSFREPFAASMAGELEKLLSELAPAIGPFPGAWIQPKGLSASIHYRQAQSDDVPALIERVRQIAKRFENEGKFVLRGGKMVLEIRPAADWHKGKAVEWLSERFSSEQCSTRQFSRGGLPPLGAAPLRIFLGDDQTDEDAFAVLPDGITMLVGDRPTAAKFRTPDPAAAHRFLDWLLQTVAE